MRLNHVEKIGRGAYVRKRYFQGAEGPADTRPLELHPTIAQVRPKTIFDRPIPHVERPTDDRQRAVCANDTPSRAPATVRGQCLHTSVERPRLPRRSPRSRTGHVSPGPRPKCVRRDRAPRRTNEHIYMVSIGLLAWLKLIHSPNRSFRPVVGPSFQGRFDGSCALSARNGTPASARPSRSWRLPHKAASALKIRLAPQRPYSTSRSHRERDRSNRGLARRSPLHCAMVERTQYRPIAKIYCMLRRNKQQNRLTSRNVIDQTAAIPDSHLKDS